jgi:biotin synthase-like enzyme
MDNNLEPRVEHQLTQHAHDQYLKKLHQSQSYDELLQAALMLNQLYSMERVKVDWAIREASNNLAELCGYDRDSC